MSKSFKGKYIPFFTRLAKRMAPAIVIIIFALLKLFQGRRAENYAPYRIYILIFLGVCFLIGLYYHIDKIRTVVNEVRISDTQIHIIGQDFSSKYEDYLDINKTSLEIQEEELGKNKTRYCLEIYCDDKYYYLNKFNDWQYATLAEVVEEFKLKSGKTVMGMQYYTQLT